MRGRRPILKAIEGGKAKAVPPPPHLPRAQHADWNAIVADLQERGLYVDTMSGVVASYVTAVWLIAECRKALAKDGAFVRTKTGEPKPHPAAGMMNKNMELVARLGAELGLTPSSRARKGMGGTEAPGDDDDASALGL